LVKDCTFTSGSHRSSSASASTKLAQPSAPGFRREDAHLCKLAERIAQGREHREAGGTGGVESQVEVVDVVVDHGNAVHRVRSQDCRPRLVSPLVGFPVLAEEKAAAAALLDLDALVLPGQERERGVNRDGAVELEVAAGAKIRSRGARFVGGTAEPSEERRRRRWAARSASAAARMRERRGGVCERVTGVGGGR
jgi:hypothetical protein